jgi:penicillin-binding protein 2
MSGLAMAMFGVILFRLWYLQVLSGEQYVHRAEANRIRDVPIAAPRGDVLDRHGRPIVQSETTSAVEIVPGAMPAAIARQAVMYRESLAKAQLSHRGPRPKLPIPPLPAGASRARSLLARLGRVIHVAPGRIDERVVLGMAATPYADVQIKTHGGPGAFVELAERQREYPGVVQKPLTLRSYPFGDMAAQILGHIGQLTAHESKLRGFRNVMAGTVVGQDGLEYYYDRYLRGQPGVERVAVDAEGLPVPEQPASTAPTAGLSLRTTLDLGLQRESERALREGIAHAHASGKPANAAAFLAMNPLDGEIYSIGSYPTFNPTRFTKPLTPEEFAELEGSATSSGRDRAVSGEYPTGSTFKPITALAALEAGAIGPNEGLGAGRCIYVSTQPFCNAGKTDYGAVGLVQALQVSSDTYFFEVGKRTNSRAEVIQQMAHKLGIGQETGIDLPSELSGIVPDAEWRARQNAKELRCRERTHQPSCGIVAEVRPWSVGDNMDLTVGQGDLLTNPLQMAVAYSTLANAYRNNGDGQVVTPHLALQIDNTHDGSLLQSFNPKPKHSAHLNMSDLSLVMEGIHAAASQPTGTSYDVWRGWNQTEHPVYGKTGTAERGRRKEDQSWYVAYVADPKRPIVIAVTVEEGGFGAETAAPIARLIAAEWFGKPLTYNAGTSRTF